MMRRHHFSSRCLIGRCLNIYHSEWPLYLISLRIHISTPMFWYAPHSGVPREQLSEFSRLRICSQISISIST